MKALFEHPPIEPLDPPAGAAQPMPPRGRSEQQHGLIKGGIKITREAPESKMEKPSQPLQERRQRDKRHDYARSNQPMARGGSLTTWAQLGLQRLKYKVRGMLYRQP